jgi:hypothetical protein
MRSTRDWMRWARAFHSSGVKPHKAAKPAASSVEGKNRAVGGDDAAAVARQVAADDDRPRRLGAKGVALRELEINRAGGHQGRKQQESRQANPQAAARIDSRGQRALCGV